MVAAALQLMGSSDDMDRIVSRSGSGLAFRHDIMSDDGGSLAWTEGASAGA